VLIQSCKKGTLPIVTTAEVSGITINSAISGGEVTDDGGCDITEKGVCWNFTGNPTITDPRSRDGEGSGAFTSNLTGLEQGKTYYARAYATNGPGTSYGEEITFTTKVADVDGNQYVIVKIGSQVWMSENLKTTKLNDNTDIPLVADNTEWEALSTPGYCWYNNDDAFNKPIYGALYNWHAVNNSKLCPLGWHVPTDAEYKTLELGIGLPQAQLDTYGWRGTDQGAQLKSNAGWNSGENGNNSTGFTALPGGYRYYENGAYYGQNTLSYWWTASFQDDVAAFYRRLDGNNNGVYRASTDKRAGKYVRCIKD